VSYNLLTPSRTPTGNEIAVRDQETLRVVNAWLADTRFASRRVFLEAIKQRLERFVNGPQTH
jgi:hypothetical protein